MKEPKAKVKSLKLAGFRKLSEIVDPIKLSKLVEHHFPDYSGPNFDWYAIHMGHDGGNFFVDHTEESRRLVRMEKAALTLWNEYERLPGHLQSIANHGIKFPIDENVVPLVSLLRRTVYEMVGRDPWNGATELPGVEIWPNKEGAIDRAKKRLTQLTPESAQQRLYEAGKKAQLARIAVIIWEECSGKDAPKAPSPSHKVGSFFAFLSEIISLAGESWSVERVMETYQRAKKDT